jgi:hypothetical protein
VIVSLTEALPLGVTWSFAVAAACVALLAPLLAAVDAREVVRFAALEPLRAALVPPLLARDEPLLADLLELRELVLLLPDEPLLLLRDLLPGERLVEPLLAACARAPLAPLPFFEVDFVLFELVARPRDVLFASLVPESDPLLDVERPRADDDRLEDPRLVVAAIVPHPPFGAIRPVICRTSQRTPTHRYPNRRCSSHPGRMSELGSTFS